MVLSSGRNLRLHSDFSDFKTISPITNALTCQNNVTVRIVQALNVRISASLDKPSR